MNDIKIISSNKKTMLPAIMNIDTSLYSTDNVFAMPIYGNNVTIDWGDGNSDYYDIASGSSPKTHDYGVNGTFEVKIYGKVTGLGVGKQFHPNRTIPSMQMVTDFIDWGDLPLTGLSDLFLGASNIQTVPNWLPPTVTSLYGLFHTCNSSVFLNLTGWDTSNVNDMRLAFGTYAPYAGWNTCNINADISTWNTPSVTNMDMMFCGNRVFSGDLSNFNTSNVTNMGSMFAYNSPDHNISGWNTGKVTNMESMFYYSSSNPDITGWDVSKVTSMKSMFMRNRAFNRAIGTWNTSSLTTVYRMFADYWSHNSSFDQSLAGWDITNISDFGGFIGGVSGLSTANYDATLISWASQTPIAGRTIDFGNSKYTLGGAAEAAKNTLETTYGWTISDGGGI